MLITTRDLFTLFSHLIRKKNAYIVRQKICNYISLNPSQFALVMDPFLYVSKMRQETTQAGHIEMQAFCELYQFCLVFHDLKNNTKSVFSPKSGPFRHKQNITLSQHTYSTRVSLFYK